MAPDDLQNRFKFHPPKTDEKRESHEDVRARCLELAEHLNEVLPEGREKSMTVTKLEEVMFWANAGLARGE